MSRGPLAHVGSRTKARQIYLSEAVYPLRVPVLHFMDDPVFLGQIIAWNRRRVLSPKHIHPEVLLLCVSDISMVLCVVLEVFKCGGPYSCPAPVPMPSKITQGEGLAWVNRGWCGCLHQTSYLCQSWPICSGPVSSLVAPLVTMEENRFILLPRAALKDWVVAVERESHSLLGLEQFYLSKLRKNKTLAEAWAAFDLEKI